MNAVATPFDYILARANIPDKVVTQTPVARMLTGVRDRMVKQGVLTCISGVFLLTSLAPTISASQQNSNSGPSLPLGVRDMGTAVNIEQVHEESIDMECVMSRRPDLSPQITEGYTQAASAYSQALQKGDNNAITATRDAYSQVCRQIMDRSGLENTYIALKTERITDEKDAELRAQADLDKPALPTPSDDIDM